MANRSFCIIRTSRSLGTNCDNRDQRWILTAAHCVAGDPNNPTENMWVAAMPFVVLVNFIIFLKRHFKLKTKDKHPGFKKSSKNRIYGILLHSVPILIYPCLLGMFDLVTMTWPTKGTPQKRTLSKSTSISNMLSELVCTIHLDFILNKAIKIYESWVLEVSEMIRTPFSYNDRTTNNDVALLKLKEKIDFKKFAGTVAPVCLPDLPRKYYDKTVTKSSCNKDLTTPARSFSPRHLSNFKMTIYS